MSGKKKSIHVLHNPNGGWDTKKDKAERASGHFNTKVEAEQYRMEETSRRAMFLGF